MPLGHVICDCRLSALETQTHTHIYIYNHIYIYVRAYDMTKQLLAHVSIHVFSYFHLFIGALPCQQQNAPSTTL